MGASNGNIESAVNAADGISDFVLSPHALLEMQRRGIDEATIRQVVTRPEQRDELRPGRDVLQSRTELRGKMYLLRVFVDVDRLPAEVVTVYRTSKVDKYWRGES